MAAGLRFFSSPAFPETRVFFSQMSVLQELLKGTKSWVLKPDIFFSKIPKINIWNSSSINVFQKEVLKSIRREPHFTYNIHDTKGLKLLTRLQLGLSLLGDRKFRHNFQDCISSMCSCGQVIEPTAHFLLHCPNHHCARKTLFLRTTQVSWPFSRQSDSTITKMLLFGDNKKEFETNKVLLMSKIELISLTKRFSCPLFE